LIDDTRALSNVDKAPSLYTVKWCTCGRGVLREGHDRDRKFSMHFFEWFETIWLISGHHPRDLGIVLVRRQAQPSPNRVLRSGNTTNMGMGLTIATPPMTVMMRKTIFRKQC